MGWFELLYDLVLVAALTQASHAFVAYPTWAMAGSVMLALLVLFGLWLLTTLSHDLVPGDFAYRRRLVLLQMPALLVAALAMGRGEPEAEAIGLAALAVAFGTVAATYAVKARRHGHRIGPAGLIARSTGAAAGLLLIASGLAWWPSTAAFSQWLLGASALVAVLPLLTVFLHRIAGPDTVLDEEHLAERLGQLVIIVLGESFLSLASTVGGLKDFPNPVFFALTFMVVFGIWSIYFASVPPTSVPVRANPLRGWLAAHYLLVCGAVATASAFSSLSTIPMGQADPGAQGSWSPISLLSVMVALTALTWLSTPRDLRLIRLHLATCAALALLTVIGLAVLGNQIRWATGLAAVIIGLDAVVAARIGRATRISAG